MILGNLCANRVEAIVFPQFKIPTIITIPGKPPQLQTIPQDIPTTSDFDPVGAGFLATEVTSGLLGGLYNNPENTAQTENKQKPDSKPTTDTNGEIKPPP